MKYAISPFYVCKANVDIVKQPFKDNFDVVCECLGVGRQSAVILWSLVNLVSVGVRLKHQRDGHRFESIVGTGLRCCGVVRTLKRTYKESIAGVATLVERARQTHGTLMNI